MKWTRIGGLLCVPAAFFLFFTAATQPQQEDEYIVHAVKKGETVSLLCIDYYGYYSAELGQAFAKENPEVKDINKIIVGQKLKFHRPEKPSDSTARAATAVSLYEQKVAATQGVVTYVEGSATLVPHSGQKKQSLAANVLVYPGDVIETGANGRAELIINRESVVRLKENTRMTVEAFRDNAVDKGKTRMAFSGGTIWTKVKKFKDSICRFELMLPTAIAGVHGTVYQTSVEGDSSAEVKVYTGEVAVQNKPSAPEATDGAAEVAGPGEVAGPAEVSMEQWTQIVRSMQKLSIDKKGKASTPQKFTKKTGDSWEQWNEERDRRIAEMFTEI